MNIQKLHILTDHELDCMFSREPFADISSIYMVL